MKLLGLDFTSAPSPQKPLVLAQGRMVGKVLELECLRDITGPRQDPFSLWETLLDSPGPWLLATDVPLGMPRGLFDHVDWPRDTWRNFANHVGGMTRSTFRQSIESLTVPRDGADTQGKAATKLLRLKRATDLVAGSACPMNCVRPPVGLMFHEAIKRLSPRPITVLPQDTWVLGDRLVIEAYSRLVVEALLGGRKPYKESLSPGKTRSSNPVEMEYPKRLAQGDLARFNRRRILQAMTRDHPPRGVLSLQERYGFRLRMAPPFQSICLEDDSADWLDSVLCLVQAGWSYLHREENWGIPPGRDFLEGWIVDPKTYQPG